MRRVRRRLTPFVPDEIMTQEAVVAFYEKRLDEALDKLGELIAANDEKKALRQRV